MNMTLLKIKILHPLKIQWYEIQIKWMGAWNFFLKQQKSKEKSILRKHYNSPKEGKFNHDIILMFNGFTWAGGLADRLRAITDIYSWCKRHKRHFSINFCTPFMLQDYLIPNKYDWIPNEISYNKEQSDVKVCMLEPRTCNRPEVFNKISQLSEDWCNSNLNDKTKQIHVYTNLFNLNENFGNLFNELFSPCKRLQEAIDYHLSQINGTYISISFRFTTLLGDFTDCTGIPLPDDEREILIEKSIEALKHIAKTAPIHDKILITADSCTFLNRLKNIPNIYIIPGKIGHIDYDQGDDITMKTFLDFYMISKAEAVYLAKGPGMYRSAFARTASYINNKPFEIYEY